MNVPGEMGPRTRTLVLLGAVVSVMTLVATCPIFAGESRVSSEDTDINPEKLVSLFTAAHVKAEIDQNGGVLLQEAGLKTVIEVDPKKKTLTYLSIWPMKESCSELEKLRFVNTLNERLLLVRFSMPKPTVLWCDYQMSFESGISPRTIVATYRIHARVVERAMATMNPKNMVGKQREAGSEISVRFTECEPIPQPVNQKTLIDEGGRKHASNDHEVATFRFRVHNTSRLPIAVSRAELLVDSCRVESYSMMTTVLHHPIDHSAHTKITINEPSVGDIIAVPLRIVIQPDASGEFVLWFALAPDASKREVVLFVTGRLRLHYDGGCSTSNPFDLEFHSGRYGSS